MASLLKSHGNDDRQSDLDRPVAVVVLVAARSPLWNWARVVGGPSLLRSTAGLRFVKVLGSGHDGGFGLQPSGNRHGIYAVFDRLEHASDFLDRSALMQGYRHHAQELCTVLLHPIASRGSWSGHALPPLQPRSSVGGPVAALTRASIRITCLQPFWKMAPASQRAVETAPGCRLAVGLGEAPLLRQATFSIWDDSAALSAYAHHGAHRLAIEAARNGSHFAEQMFVRFIPERLEGVWKGRRLG